MKNQLSRKYLLVSPEKENTNQYLELQMTIIDQDIEVKLILIHKPPMLARASVIFGKTVETHGWRIFQSVRGEIHPRFQEPIWIQPPSYRAIKGKDGKWIWKPTVWVANKRLYSAIEDRIYDAYCLKRNLEDKSDQYNLVKTKEVDL